MVLKMFPTKKAKVYNNELKDVFLNCIFFKHQWNRLLKQSILKRFPIVKVTVYNNEWKEVFLNYMFFKISATYIIKRMDFIF